MLTLALVTGASATEELMAPGGDIRAGEDDRRLALALRQLQGAVQAGTPLVIIDTGGPDSGAGGRLTQLQDFVDGPGRGAVFLRLDQPGLSFRAALELARSETGADYVLGLTGQDLLLPAALAPLQQQLAQQHPDLVICGQGWWQGGPLEPLAPPDADRLVARQSASLWPDTRRLLPAAAFAAEFDLPENLSDDPLEDWYLWDGWLDLAQHILVFAGPVVLRPLPASRVVNLFASLKTRLAGCPRRQRRALLLHAMSRVGDELTFCDPANALSEAAAAWEFYQTLGRRERGVVVQDPGSAGALMSALNAGGPSLALAVLAQQAAAQDRARLTAMRAEVRALRADLDLALPGPDYLRDLYERVRFT